MMLCAEALKNSDSEQDEGKRTALHGIRKYRAESALGAKTGRV